MSVADQLSLDDVAHARSTDPATSHLAAASVTEIGQTQQTILRVLALAGRGLTDPEIYDRCRDLGCLRSAAGVRSRRAELVRRGLVVAAEVTVLPGSASRFTSWCLAGSE